MVAATAVNWSGGRPRVPEFLSNETTHRQLLARSLNQIAQGTLDCTITATLASGATSSVFKDARINTRTCASFAPTTAHAGAEIAAGMWWVCGNGQVTVHHQNTADTDKTFILGIVG